MKNVAVFGSCVSRDAVELMRDRCDPVHYTARQSWISANSKPTWAPPVDRLKSGFQKRTLRRDFASSLLGEIRLETPAADLVLIDLVDERLGVIQTWPGRYVTVTSELGRSGWLTGDRWIRRKRSALGDSEHFDLFSRGALEVRRALMESNAWDKTVVFKAPFASQTDQGDATGLEAGLPAEQWNELYEPYYRLLGDFGFKVVEPHEEEVRSSETHKWGPAPYHYAEATSVSLLTMALQHVGTPF